MLGESPLEVLKFPFLLIKGKAHLKQFISKRTSFSAALLPYNLEFLEWLKTQKSAGRYLVLCTASDKGIAKPIADYLGVFDEVLASDGSTNLSGISKATALVDRFGSRRFDYCGNATIDLQVWKDTNSAIVVNARKSLLGRVKLVSTVSNIFEKPEKRFKNLIDALHLSQWLIGLVIIVPLFLLLREQGSINNNLLYQGLTILYLSFSTLPILRDLLCLEEDRKKKQAKSKPIAAGEVSILCGASVVLVSLTIIFVLLLTILI